jgi:hypothetical protein
MQQLSESGFSGFKDEQDGGGNWNDKLSRKIGFRAILPISNSYYRTLLMR